MATTEAITYRTGTKARDLRTVIVDDVRKSVVLLPTGSLDVVTAKLLCGSQCATPFWHEQLGISGADFAVTANQVVARRPITVATIAKHNHVEA
jgi:hypothetical protein